MQSLLPATDPSNLVFSEEDEAIISSTIWKVQFNDRVLEWEFDDEVGAEAALLALELGLDLGLRKEEQNKITEAFESASVADLFNRLSKLNEDAETAKKTLHHVLVRIAYCSFVKHLLKRELRKHVL